MFMTVGGERRISLNVHHTEFFFFTAQETCRDKDRLASHVTAKIFALVVLTGRTILGKFFVGDGKSNSGFHNAQEIQGYS